MNPWLANIHATLLSDGGYVTPGTAVQRFGDPPGGSRARHLLMRASQLGQFRREEDLTRHPNSALAQARYYAIELDCEPPAAKGRPFAQAESLGRVRSVWELGL